MVLWHEERDTILTMLTIPNVWHVLCCTRSQFISAGRDPKNLTAVAAVKNSTLCLNGRNSTSQLNGPTSTDSLSKSLNSQDYLFWAWCHPHSSPISCLGVCYDNGDCHILCTRAWTAPIDYTPGLLTRIVQSPTKLNDKI